MPTAQFLSESLGVQATPQKCVGVSSKGPNLAGLTVSKFISRFGFHDNYSITASCIIVACT